VYEIDGDQVAVTFDLTKDVIEEARKSEDPKAQDALSSIFWADSMFLFLTNA
jgi:hypothetical protein